MLGSRESRPMTQRKSNIVIADDHALVRDGLRQAIERDARFVVVAEASDGQEALEQIQTHRPDVAVLDIRMPKLDGLAVARELRSRRIDVALVFLTLHDDEDLLDSALELGARGYLLKASAVPEIVDGLRAVADGNHYVSSALTGHLIGRRASSHAKSEVARIGNLSPAERRVLRLLAEYQSNQEIAEQLFVHRRTVQTHRANICQKLDLRGHNALLRFALEHKHEL